MAKKHEPIGLPIISVRTKERGTYELFKGEDSGASRLMPTHRSRLVEREIDVRAALDDYLAVASLHALWTQSDRAHRYADDPEVVAALKLDTAQLRQRGKHRHRLRDEFEQALVAATNTHGPLGVGYAVRAVLQAIDDLAIFAVSDQPDQLRKIPGFRTDAVKVSPALLGRVNEALLACTIWKGHVDCADLFGALCWRVYFGDLQFRVCDVCESVFVSQRGKTCSDRCRQRKRYGK